MAALNNQIYQIIRGHRATDDYKLAKDELCRTLNIDWNTTRAPLVPDEEFINKARVNTVRLDKFQLLKFVCLKSHILYVIGVAEFKNDNRISLNPRP